MGVSAAVTELPGWALELLERSRVARLGLLDAEGAPRVLPVTYALHADCVWTAIDSKPKRGEPARVRYLRRRPVVALTIDHYSDDWGSLAWVQLLGRASLLPPARARGALGALAARYVQYRDCPPPGPLIRIEIERALSWRASEPER